MRRRPVYKLITLGVAMLGAAVFVIPTSASAATAPGLVAQASTSNTAPPSDLGAYGWVNYYRGLAGLNTVSRNATLEVQEGTHVRYLADHSLSCETNVHDELTQRLGGCGANRYATMAGKAAANNSNIVRVSTSVTDRTAVSSWMVAGFHALTMLDPRLASTGYAAYFTPHPTGAKPLAWDYTAGLDVYRGRTGQYANSVIAFPGANAATPLLSYAVGTESPEPFRSALSTSPCRAWGNKSVVSAPIIVQWPKAARVSSQLGKIVDVTTGAAQATCSLNAASYARGSLPNQFLGGSNGITQAALYYMATPFVSGHKYEVVVANQAITKFSAGAVPAAPTMYQTPRGAGTTTVSWKDNAPGVTSHLVQLYSGPNCSGTLLANGRTTAMSVTYTRLIRGHLYSVRASGDTATIGRWSGCLNFKPS